MATKRATRGRTASRGDKMRKQRARPTPRWILEQQDLDDIARRRCLMLLSVLSGETPVSTAIREAEISRGMYYELESRALNAMLRALTPGATAEETASAGLTKHCQELEQRVEKMEKEKRRAERLLFMTKKVMKPGPLKQAPGRPRKSSRPTSTKSGKEPSPNSKAPTENSTKAPKNSSETKNSKPVSTPTKLSADER